MILGFEIWKNKVENIIKDIDDSKLSERVKTISKFFDDNIIWDKDIIYLKTLWYIYYNESNSKFLANEKILKVILNV